MAWYVCLHSTHVGSNDCSCKKCSGLQYKSCRLKYIDENCQRLSIHSVFYIFWWERGDWMRLRFWFQKPYVDREKQQWREKHTHITLLEHLGASQHRLPFKVHGLSESYVFRFLTAIWGHPPCPQLVAGPLAPSRAPGDAKTPWVIPQIRRTQKANMGSQLEIGMPPSRPINKNRSKTS